MTRYINIKTVYGVETIEEVDYNTREERKIAMQLLKDYRLNGMSVYLSRRSTKDWREQ